MKSSTYSRFIHLAIRSVERNEERSSNDSNGDEPVLMDERGSSNILETSTTLLHSVATLTAINGYCSVGGKEMVYESNCTP